MAECCPKKVCCVVKECFSNCVTVNASGVDVPIKEGSPLVWTSINKYGEDIELSDDGTQICLKGGCRRKYQVSFYINFKHKETVHQNVYLDEECEKISKGKIIVNLVSNGVIIFNHISSVTSKDEEISKTITLIIPALTDDVKLELINDNKFTIYHNLTAGDISRIR